MIDPRLVCSFTRNMQLSVHSGYHNLTMHLVRKWTTNVERMPRVHKGIGTSCGNGKSQDGRLNLILLAMKSFRRHSLLAPISSCTAFKDVQQPFYTDST